MTLIDEMKELWSKGFSLQDISISLSKDVSYLILEIQKNKEEAFFQREHLTAMEELEDIGFKILKQILQKLMK